MQHLDDDAELYALGLTGTERSGEIEAHLAECGDCRARVAEAESVAASLAAALPPVPSVRIAAPPQRRWLAPLAAAAALVFAATTAFEGAAAHAASAQLAQTSLRLSVTNFALFNVASTHFAHTTLSARRGVIAKALYARDGTWCYVLVAGAPGAHVVMRQGSGKMDFGPLGSEMPASFFIRGLGPIDRIDIVDRDTVVAHGNLSY